MYICLSLGSLDQQLLFIVGYLDQLLTTQNWVLFPMTLFCSTSEVDIVCVFRFYRVVCGDATSYRGAGGARYHSAAAAGEGIYTLSYLNQPPFWP